jgi:hypothetical protein
VREHQDLFRNLLEHVVSGGTRSRFQALAALLDFHFLDRERNAPALAELAAEIRPGVRIGTQAMVDMNGTQPFPHFFS